VVTLVAVPVAIPRSHIVQGVEHKAVQPTVNTPAAGEGVMEIEAEEETVEEADFVEVVVVVQLKLFGAYFPKLTL
jgi:hypothetical protein